MMLLQRNFIASTLIRSRNISASASRCLDVPSSKPLTEQRQQELEDSKKTLEWRVKPFERKGAWYSKFKLLMQDDNEATTESLAVRLQKPIDLRPKAIKKWWNLNNQKQERFLQQFIPERHEILGNDLAAAHFLLYRGGKVRFFQQKEWISGEEGKEIDLPNKFVPNMVLEAIDCEGMDIYYEGLENLRRLKYLRFISFKNVKNFDDWCLDRLAGSEFESLEILNLAGTEISYRGLGALYKIPSLKKLILSDPDRDIQWKLSVAMLQDLFPKLEIIEIKTVAAP